jgi:tetratricopeptide (TPR) repeat protein
MLRRPRHPSQAALSLGVLLLAALLSGCASPRPQQDFLDELSTLPEGGSVVPGFTGGFSASSQPGPALQAVVRYWGADPLSAAEVSGLVQDPSDTVTLEEKIHAVLDPRGLWQFSFYAVLDEVAQRIDAGVPVIVLIEDIPGYPPSRTYAVVAGYNRVAGKVLVHKGGRHGAVLDEEEFKARWRPVRNWTMTVCPPDRANWSLRMVEVGARARYHERREAWDDALFDLAVAQAFSPGNMDLILVEAFILYRAGRLPEAIAGYRGVLEANPYHARAANNLAFLLADAGQVDEAVLWARRALTLEPSNPAYLDTLGSILLLQEQSVEAAAVLARAWQRGVHLGSERHAAIARRLIEAYLDSGQPHLARQIFAQQTVRDAGFELPPALAARMPPPPVPDEQLRP